MWKKADYRVEPPATDVWVSPCFLRGDGGLKGMPNLEAALASGATLRLAERPQRRVNTPQSTAVSPVDPWRCQEDWCAELQTDSNDCGYTGGTEPGKHDKALPTPSHQLPADVDSTGCIYQIVSL
ncbi:hypothetical protein DPEC_G00137570 [Dallia pectoralis]|uniref:Uncharacterized protein n=1 Tax=Dallia pectoralis TaxID=75939 RepID=A0ACC2GLR6_DALPE|nr:hypothetical protein DPEC_G00137570 [Dallia pectoralis]